MIGTDHLKFHDSRHELLVNDTCGKLLLGEVRKDIVRHSGSDTFRGDHHELEHGVRSRLVRFQVTHPQFSNGRTLWMIDMLLIWLF